jgi:hypothetical protein
MLKQSIHLLDLITKEQLDEGFALVEKALEVADRKVK